MNVMKFSDVFFLFCLFCPKFVSNLEQMKVSIFEKPLPSGKVSFYLHYSIHGKRRKDNLRLGTFKKGSEAYKESKRFAEILKGKKMEELISGTHEIETRKLSAMGIKEYFQNYEKGYKGKDKRKVTSLILNYVFPFFGSDRRLQSISEDECIDFLEHLKRELKAETIKNYYGIFKRSLAKAERKSLIRKSPAHSVKMKLPEQKRLNKDVLTFDELSLLYRTPCGNDEVKRAFLLACNTGLSKAEVEELDWKDVKNGVLSYFRLKTSRNIRVDVSLNENALVLLGKKGSAKVFGKLPTSNGANKTLQSWVDRAGIDKHITFYCARHTFGTLQALRGANQMVIAKNMGHLNTRRTDLYVNHVDQARTEAIQFPTFVEFAKE